MTSPGDTTSKPKHFRARLRTLLRQMLYQFPARKLPSRDFMECNLEAIILAGSANCTGRLESGKNIIPPSGSLRYP
jgi:hypothetical protein